MAGLPEEARPSPDALLKAAEKEARGKHKIFLGAAPGVVKTYEMLTSARRRKEEGIDVVVGVVETHGRAETEALVHGLEMVARQPVDYHGRTIAEMDIDAILARAPQPLERRAQVRELFGVEGLKSLREVEQQLDVAFHPLHELGLFERLVGRVCGQARHLFWPCGPIGAPDRQIIASLAHCLRVCACGRAGGAAGRQALRSPRCIVSRPGAQW